MDKPSCYNQALKLLASRPHFRAELAAKLARRAYPDDEIESTLDRLTERGLLDEAQATAGFVAGRKVRGEGKMRIAAELRRRGAADEAAATALAGLPDDDTPQVREAAERWQARGGHDPAALARHLARKGFSHRAIFAVLRERGTPGAAPQDPDDP